LPPEQEVAGSNPAGRAYFQMVNLTLIHGFTQDSTVWDRVIASLPSDWTVDSIDLPGHGQRGDMRPTGPNEFLAQTGSFLEPLTGSERRILCGYSMGGRVALQLALLFPQRWTDIVVVSSGPGITDPYAREVRVQADELAAQQLDEGWIEEFAARWDSLPLWEGDPDHVRDDRRAMILRQDPSGLAAALRGFGQGSAPAFGGFGPGTAPGLTVIRGERDIAYVDATERLATLGTSAPVVIPGGHSLPLESPGALAGVLSSI